MPTKVGVGRSDAPDAFQSGAAAARAALAQAGLESCDFVFMFATIGYDQQELLRGVRSVTLTAPLAGCSGEGVITQAGPEGETTFGLSGPKAGTSVVGVMVIASDEIRLRTASGIGVKSDSRQVAESIGKSLYANRPDDAFLLWMFVDGLNSNVKKFMDGLDASIGGPLPYVGGSSGEDFIQGQTYQYCDDRVLQDGAVCVLASGDLKFEMAVSHGCVPIGLEKTITRAKDNTVYTIENETAWGFFKQYLDEKWTKFTREIRTFLDFGIKLPDDLATDYDRYIIRAPFGQNADDSLNFATEMPAGTKVQVIRRDAEKISQGSKKMAERIKAKLGDKKPIAVVHIDCAARGKMFFGEDVKEKEIDVMQDVFGKDVPWIGLFACGEIAPIKNINYYHNQTAILCVLYR
jgi:hypothetical protein